MGSVPARRERSTRHARQQQDPSKEAKDGAEARRMQTMSRRSLTSGCPPCQRSPQAANLQWCPQHGLQRARERRAAHKSARFVSSPSRFPCSYGCQFFLSLSESVKMVSYIAHSRSFFACRHDCCTARFFLSDDGHPAFPSAFAHRLWSLQPFVKLVKNKAYYKRFQVKYRRRRGLYLHV